MRSKTSLRGHKTRRGKKLKTAASRRSRSMKLGGVQISARLQKQARPAGRLRRGRAAAKPVVAEHPVAAAIAPPIENRPVLETLPMIQPAAPHGAAKLARPGRQLAAWSMWMCVIAIIGALLFMGRPAYAPASGPSVKPLEIPAATAPELNRGVIKPAPKALTAERMPAQPIAAPAFVDLPVPPATVFSKLEEPRVIEATPALVEQAALVTITGCLDSDRDTFTLKDTSGVDAPAARNWKTGFLKKRRASIEIVDSPSGLSLRDHVGQRVSLTGNLVDRDMQVRSLRRVAASCKG